MLTIDQIIAVVFGVLTIALGAISTWQTQRLARLQREMFQNSASVPTCADKIRGRTNRSQDGDDTEDAIDHV